MHSGSVKGLLEHPDSLTGKYLSGRREIPTPEVRRGHGQGPPDHRRRAPARTTSRTSSVSFPLGNLVAVTGVSGSGKSTLVNDILYNVLANKLNGARQVPGRHKTVTGLEHLDKVVHVDQSPIGRTPRSNPATYTGVFDHIRKLFAETTEAKVRGYQPGRFSFNVKGGRCDACSGDGTIKIEMNFLPDVYVPCEVCHGARYNRETLEVHFKGKTIADVLDMPIEEAADVLRGGPRDRAAPARRSTTSASATCGSASRRRPSPAARRSASSSPAELQKRSTGRTIYVLDEPTTGLHFEDIRKLLDGAPGPRRQGQHASSSSSTTSTSSRAPTGSSTWGPRAAAAAAWSSPRARPSTSPRSSASHTGRFLKPILERTARTTTRPTARARRSTRRGSTATSRARRTRRAPSRLTARAQRQHTDDEGSR